MNFTSTASFLWSVADLLRGDYKQSDYGKVILPFTLLRRLDCVLEPTKAAVLAEYQAKKALGIPLDPLLIRKAKKSFYNTSPMDLPKLLGDSTNIKSNLVSYINSFSENTRDIFERYDFSTQIERLDSSDLLYQIVQKFATVDLHPDKVSNAEMGLIFEELIRRFAELSNETAGEHYTPREVIRLMVNLLFIADDDALTKPGIVRSIYDPAAGTGGMLSVAEEHLRRLNPDARLVVFGQELNPESFAICKADMLIKGQDVASIVFGNTLSEDGHAHKAFDYMLSNPPFGVEWKKVEAAVRKEHQQKGFAGRFGPGLPRVSDGSLLFLLTLLSKMRPVDQGGSRIGIIHNGSPLFTGGAGSGESNIRKWIIENDWLEAIVALPTDMFYNTGISTYVWILTNHKKPERKGKIQLINAAEFYRKMRKSLGSKRKELSDSDIARITKLYGDFEANEYSKIFDEKDFGYSTITVERPLQLNFQASPERIAKLSDVTALTKSNGDFTKLHAALTKLDGNRLYQNREEFIRDLKKAAASVSLSLSAAQFKAVWQALSEQDETADICNDAKGRPEPDPNLRDTENVPLKEDIEEYFRREVLPHVPDAWIDHEKTKVGYEIPFSRHFYKFTPPRSLEAIDYDLQRVSEEIMGMLRDVMA
jgi:type I restriction enzyme M protein